MKRIDLSGQVFGRLTVIRRMSVSGRTRFFCQCDCGNHCIKLAHNLVSGTTKSCGCLAKETKSKTKRTNGSTVGGHTKLYRIWSNMKRRCWDHNNPRYSDYGGRGITVCERWHSFANF